MRVHPSDYDLEAVREEWIGKLVGDATGRFPVEFDPIRRHCHMTGDLNPAYLYPDASKTGVHGTVIVPPSMLPIYFASGGPWPPREPRADSDTPNFTFGVPTPGDRGINMSVEWDFLEPIRVGDRLRLETRIADIYEKPIKLDAHAIWISTESTIFNQHDTAVTKWRNTVLAHRSPDQVKEDEARENLGRQLGDAE